MGERDDGGAAFPIIPPLNSEVGHGGANGYPFPGNGMSLRDYFAGQAMLGYNANWLMNFYTTVAFRAKWAYREADAMLAERRKP